MQIVVHHVETEIARAHDAGDRVQIGAVAIDEAAAAVDEPHHLFEVLLEQAERIRVGHHDAGERVVAGGAHRLEIDIAARVGGNLDRREARHGGRGRIGAVRGIRNENAGAPGVTALAMIGAHHQEPGELAVGAGGGLQRHRGKSADLGEPLLQLEHQGEIALHGLRLLQRMRLGEARDPRDLLVLLGIEFHGAGAERIEAGVDAEIALRQREIVAHDIELRQLRQPAIVAQLGRRQRRLRHVRLRQVDAVPAGHAQLVDGRDGWAS